MKDKKFALVTTTINIPYLLEEYAADARKFNRKVDCFIVVGDKKTPSGTDVFCKNLQDKFGVKCKYFSVEEQELYLKKWPGLKAFIPWNCMQRRNIGLLYAYFDCDCDVIITLDDDNLLHDSDYFGAHNFIGEHVEIKTVKSASGWWNLCGMLKEERNIPFYHRGHPLSKRFLAKENELIIGNSKKRVVVNAGLWMEEPDVDAFVRLCFPVKIIGINEKFHKNIACDVGTWAPFDSQNTALSKDVIPAYFLFPYIGRYDDIWASYVVRHITDHIGDLVSYGSPLVRQKRNPHNYLKDFDAERFGLEYNDIFIEALRLSKLISNDYKSAFGEISESFATNVAKVCKINKIDVSLFDQVTQGFSVWADIF